MVPIHITISQTKSWKNKTIVILIISFMVNLVALLSLKNKMQNLRILGKGKTKAICFEKRFPDATLYDDNDLESF